MTNLEQAARNRILEATDALAEAAIKQLEYMPDRAGYLLDAASRAFATIRSPVDLSSASKGAQASPAPPRKPAAVAEWVTSLDARFLMLRDITRLRFEVSDGTWRYDDGGATTWLVRPGDGRWEFFDTYDADR